MTSLAGVAAPPKHASKVAFRPPLRLLPYIETCLMAAVL
jgi:hypothetical protein